MCFAVRFCVGSPSRIRIACSSICFCWYTVMVWTCAGVRRSCRSSFVILSFRDLFVECLKVDRVRPNFVEALAVGRCAIDTFVRAKGCVFDVEALFDAFGSACRAFVLLVCRCFCGCLCRGVLGLFFK